MLQEENHRVQMVCWKSALQKTYKHLVYTESIYTYAYKKPVTTWSGLMWFTLVDPVQYQIKTTATIVQFYIPTVVQDPLTPLQLKNKTKQESK